MSDWVEPEHTESAFLQSALTSQPMTFEDYTYERTRLAVEQERDEMIAAASAAGRDIADRLTEQLGYPVRFSEVQLLKGQ